MLDSRYCSAFEDFMIETSAVWGLERGCMRLNGPSQRLCLMSTLGVAVIGCRRIVYLNGEKEFRVLVLLKNRDSVP